MIHFLKHNIWASSLRQQPTNRVIAARCDEGAKSRPTPLPRSPPLPKKNSGVRRHSRRRTIAARRTRSRRHAAKRREKKGGVPGQNPPQGGRRRRHPTRHCHRCRSSSRDAIIRSRSEQIVPSGSLEADRLTPAGTPSHRHRHRRSLLRSAGWSRTVTLCRRVG
nr:hypothetical protein Iba_chr09dCG4850 [Ipomoea batatas]